MIQPPLFHKLHLLLFVTLVYSFYKSSASEIDVRVLGSEKEMWTESWGSGPWWCQKILYQWGQGLCKKFHPTVKTRTDVYKNFWTIWVGKWKFVQEGWRDYGILPIIISAQSIPIINVESLVFFLVKLGTYPRGRRVNPSWTRVEGLPNSSNHNFSPVYPQNKCWIPYSLQ